MIKTKKQMFIIIGAFLLVLMLGTTTYAFFNYTRTGTSNTIRVGRISFVTRQTETINLTNVFPIDRANVDTDTENVDSVVIEIEGDTDYANGIEYLVSSVDSNISITRGNKTIDVPISLDIDIDDLGTESSNYFTTRDNTNESIYKKLVGDTLVGDGMLLVGYIVPNTTSGTAEGIDGSITIKAFFDKDKIGISDTYDGTESDSMGTTNEWARGRTIFTTNEWNSLQTNGVSFKVKVEANEGIWVMGSLEEIMRKTVVMDNTSSTYVTSSSGINFGAISSDTNGKGVYMRAGTQNDAYPIMYYRGNVDDNNVLFANKCWKTVRTTDTGGVKLIYNGEPKHGNAPINQSSYTIVTNSSTSPFTFDEIDNTWNAIVTDSNGTEISFNVPADSGYTFILTGTTGSSTGGTFYIYKDGTQVYLNGGGGGQTLSAIQEFGTLTSSNVIKFTYSGSGTLESPITFKIRMEKPSEEVGLKCDSKNLETQISVDVNGTPQTMFEFNKNYNSPAYVGYMYGDVYTYTNNSASGSYFGSSFTWDGTNYKLVDPVSTKYNMRHYTCKRWTADEKCATLRYYYYQDYYVNLTGGDGIENALTKMQVNTTNSNAKDKIDTWYSSNMNEFTNKLEDTIWCNDRSVGDNNNNGWIANGGDLGTYIYYGARERSAQAQNTSTVMNQPSLVCVNKNDRFTVSNGNGNRALDYPVALLTLDELVLAGGLAGTQNTSFYLNGGSYYWFLSPDSFDERGAREFTMGSGDIRGSDVSNTGGLRPVVSLKPGTPVVKGTGTVNNPYVIE